MVTVEHNRNSKMCRNIRTSTVTCPACACAHTHKCVYYTHTTHKRTYYTHTHTHVRAHTNTHILHTHTHATHTHTHYPHPTPLPPHYSEQQQEGSMLVGHHLPHSVTSLPLKTLTGAVLPTLRYSQTHLHNTVTGYI